MDEIFDVLSEHRVDVELHEQGSKSITLIASSLSREIIIALLNAGANIISANTEGRLIVEA